MPASVGELVGYLRLDSAGFDRGISVAQQEMRSAATSADKLSAAAATTAQRLAGAGREASLAGTASGRLRAAQLSLVAAQERYNAALAQGNASTARLASSEAAVIRANQRVAASSREAMAAAVKQAQAMDRTSSSTAAVTRTASGFAMATRSAVGLAAGFGAIAIAAKAIDLTKQAVAYQAAMVRIRALTGASTAEIERMNGALLDLSGQVAQSPLDLATSLYHVEAIGLRGADALDAVTVAAKGARIGNADLEETTNALTATIQSGIAKNQSYTATMSDLLTIVGTGDMKLSDFNESLGTGLLATMANAGVSLKDVGAAMAVFGDNNIRGANAATMLRVAVQAMQQPAKGGAAALDQIGIKADMLRNDLLKGGLNAAVSDLRGHLQAAGYDGKKAGAIIVEAFGKKANTGIGVLIHEYDLLEQKYGLLNHGAQTFEQRWNAVTDTASFHLAQLGHEAQAAGIVLAEKATPAVSHLAMLLATGLPAGLHAAGAGLTVFRTGAHAAATVVGPLASVLGDLLGELRPLAPVLSGVGSAALAMWIAFKGYQIVRDALFAIQDRAALMAASTRNSFAEMRAGFGATQAQLSTQSAIMRAEFAQIEAAALADAAAADRAAALKATAYADQVAASKAATDAQVTDAETVAASALAQARVSAEAAATSAASAVEASAAIDGAGARAAIGWRAVLGPVGLAAVGILTVISLFNRSESSSKQAAEAARAYADALKSGDKNTLVDRITSELTDKKVPETLSDMAMWLGHSAVNGREFVAAIQQGGKPLDELRGKLEAVVKAGNGGKLTGNTSVGAATAAVDAKKLLQILDDQSAGLAQAVRKDLVATKAFAGVSSSIDKVSASTKVGSDAAKKYAAMMGIAVDKNGVAAVSAATLSAAVQTVSSAYQSATQTGDAYLAALNTFAQSQGTAADRSALIGATLKAANGDALNFAGQMNASAVAVRQFRSDVRDAAKNAVKGGESTREYLKSVVDLKRGTIDYANAGAAPLISGLQSIQSAGLSAAEATYQHARATMSGKAAADAAYKTYVGQTRGALIDQLERLGANSTQAKRLADNYLGMPKNVKTLIEQQGADPIVSVLNKIGEQLAFLTGHPWTVSVKPVVEPLPPTIGGARVRSGVQGRASGGSAPEGLFWTGEGGPGARPELVEKHGPNVQVYSHEQSMAKARQMGITVPGFAAGTKPSYTLGGATYKNKSDYESALKAATSSIAAVLAAVHNVNASADAMRTAAKDLQTAARDQKLSAADQRAFAAASARLNDLAVTRDRIRTQLGSAPTAPTAYERLQQAKDAFTADQQKYSGAVSGFDVTSVTPPATSTSTQRIGSASITTTKPGGVLTAAAIIAADQQDVAQIAEFDRLIHRLVAEGLDADYVAQIAAKGATPEALETARALAKSTPAEVRKLNSLESGKGGRKAIANDLGGFLAKKFDGAGVASAQAFVNGLLSDDKRVNAAMDRFADSLLARFRKRLHIAAPRPAAHVGHQLGHATVPTHHKAAPASGHREPTPHRAQGTESRGGTQVTFQVYGQPGQSPAEIAHIASTDLLFHLDR